MEITKSKPVRLRFRFTLDGIYQVKATITDLGVNISQDDLDALHMTGEKRCEVVNLIRDRMGSILCLHVGRFKTNCNGLRMGIGVARKSCIRHGYNGYAVG